MRTTIAIRAAHADEAPIVRRLAALDSARRLRGEILLAVVDGEPVAALSLEDGRVVADPFAHTAEAVALLRVRAGMVADAVPAAARRLVPRVRALLAA